MDTYCTTPSGTRYQIGRFSSARLRQSVDEIASAGTSTRVSASSASSLRACVDVLAVELVAGPAHPDEPGQGEHLLPVLPGQDRRQRVRAGDEVEIGVRVERPQIAQGVAGVGRAAAVDVHPAHREPRIGGGGDHGHQVAVLGGGDVAGLLPRLARRHEHHFVQIEQIGNLAGRDQVPVVDGIERPAHHAQPASRLHD